MPRLDSLALNRIILGDLYPQATAEQLDKGARWRATAPTGPRAADYDRDPELFRHDLEMEMFGRAEPPHQHVVNEHSALKFNGGQPVLLCGHNEGECRVIVCCAEHDPVTGAWSEGVPYA